MRIAILSDIHGNVWALDAVLAELDRAGADRILNLGDCFFGPLAPGATFRRLAGTDWPTVRGNQDRALIDQDRGSSTADFSLREIGDDGVAWLADHTRPTVRDGALLACHGTLERDDHTLLERVEPSHVRWARPDELKAALLGAGPDIEVVLCGHSHRPGAVQLPDGRLILNPGSVGLPAYTDDLPHPHAMESGTPHARWALLERSPAGWRIELRGSPYDTGPAIEAARANGREDWARWIATGRA